MTEHLRESRDDLETRFLLMGNFVQHARSRIGEHDDPECPACIAIAEAVPIPFTVAAAAQEPREDLEEAVVSINDRLETVALGPGRADCPVYGFVRCLLVSATERLSGDPDPSPGA